MKIHYGTANPDRKKDCDYYPTPDHATEALMEREKFNGLVWECAAGQGHMAKIIERYNEVLSTDLRKDNVYGRGGVDFLLSNRAPVPNIITNPPFNYALEFAQHAKRRSTEKFALLLRLCFLEGKVRYKFFQDRRYPLKAVYLFSERVTFKPKELDDEGGGMIAFAWYVWEKGYKGETLMKWIPPIVSRARVK